MKAKKATKDADPLLTEVTLIRKALERIAGSVPGVPAEPPPVHTPGVDGADQGEQAP